VYEGAGNKVWVLWGTEPKVSKFTYDVAVVAPTGALVAKASSIFGTSYWDSLSGVQTLVTGTTGPEVVFDGGLGVTGPYSRGCVYGAQLGAPTWTLQPWSLSANCTNPIGGAAEGKGGVLAAAWPGGWATGHGVLYRVGVSASIPAATVDSHIPLSSPADAGQAAVANNLAGNGHFDVAWVQIFSSGGQDGYYVKDVTAGTPAVKAPGSGTTTANISPFAVPAITSTNTHPGVFVAYCSNTPTCAVRLWNTAVPLFRVVPGSTHAADIAISAGPDGRLWIAWFNPTNNDVSVVRTNEADTAFSKVNTYKTPCSEHGLLGLSGGAFGRVTIALQCVNEQAKLETFVTQSIVGLTIASSAHVIANTATHAVTFKVTDVGDPVPGASVIWHGKLLKTNGAGSATFTVPKGTPPGTYPVVAAAANYFSAHVALSVVK
jgi:hypothetical protein